MAITVTYEWWTGADHYALARILEDFTSGSATSMVPGLFVEGQAINQPSLLRKTCAADGIAGTVNIVGHLRARYDQDGIPLRIVNGTDTGPYVQVIAGVIKLWRSDGVLIGTATASWPAGKARSLSYAIKLATSATGSAKLWLGSDVILDLTAVQTVPAAANLAAIGFEMDGFGVFDDTGFILGTGTIVDADVPRLKRCRTRMAASTGTNQGFAVYGGAGGHVASVNETLADGDSTGVEAPDGGYLEGFFMEALPGNVGTIWGVQHVVEVRQTNPGVPRSVQFRVRNAGGVSFTGLFPAGDTFRFQRQFYRINPRTSAAWGAEFDTTQFEASVG